MTQEDKELLLIDLCARLPYGVLFMVHDDEINEPVELLSINPKRDKPLEIDDGSNENSSTYWNFEDVKPYLRPMSSMTEEEMDKIEEILGDKCIFDFMGNGDVSLHQGNFTQNTLSKLYDFYNSIHVDYRGLIEKGLALEAPEGMYN